MKSAEDAGFITKLDGVALTLEQVNGIAAVNDALKAKGDVDTPMAVAISQFRDGHEIKNNRWVKKKKSKVGEAMKEPWELKIEDLPHSFSEYPYIAKEKGLSFYRTALDAGLSEEKAEETALASLAMLWKKGDDGYWNYLGEADGTARAYLRKQAGGQPIAEETTWMESVDESWPEEGGHVEIMEAINPDGIKTSKLKLTIIKSGFSKNIHEETRKGKYRRYYPPDTLREARALFDGLPVYLGKSGHDVRPTIEDKIGTPLSNVMVEDIGAGHVAVTGESFIYPDQKKWADRIALDPTAFGPSIEAAGRVRCPAVAEGKPSANVEKLNAIPRALLVERPAAGGGASLTESENERRNINEGGDGDVEIKNIEELKANYPGFCESLIQEGKEKAIAESADADKDAQIKTLTEERNDLKKKVEESDKVVKEAESEKLIAEAFPEDLPEPVQERLKESLKGETDKAEIEAKVKEEIEYLKTSTGIDPVTVKGSGGKKPVREGEVPPHIQEAMDKELGVEKPETPAADGGAAPAAS